MDRTQLTSNCPGSLQSGTVIAVDPVAKFGISNPANVGTCPLSIGGLDQNGSPLSARDSNGNVIPGSLVLFPGDTVGWYTPPPGTMTLVFTCLTNVYSGQAILEYDTPNC